MTRILMKCVIVFEQRPSFLRPPPVPDVRGYDGLTVWINSAHRAAPVHELPKGRLHTAATATAATTAIHGLSEGPHHANIVRAISHRDCLSNLTL